MTLKKYNNVELASYNTQVAPSLQNKSWNKPLLSRKGKDFYSKEYEINNDNSSNFVKTTKDIKAPFWSSYFVQPKWSRGWEYKQDYSVINYLARFIDSKWTFWPNASDMNKWVCPIQPPKWSRPRNDPQPWNDRQIDPEIILAPKWSPLFFMSTPKWSPRNYEMVIKHGTVDCSIIRESKDILAYVVNRFTAPILTTKRE